MAHVAAIEESLQSWKLVCMELSYESMDKSCFNIQKKNIKNPTVSKGILQWLLEFKYRTSLWKRLDKNRV